MIYDVIQTPPPEDKRILVLNKTRLYDRGTLMEWAPVWREAYYYENCWRLWCGKIGATSTAPCEFLMWAHVPQ